jgi:hypothetical protein
VTRQLSTAEFQHSDVVKSLLKVECYHSHYREGIYRFPTFWTDEVKVDSKITFAQGRFSDLVIRLTYPGDDSRKVRNYLYKNQQIRIDQQDDWLHKHAGVASGEYDWGLVWNRYNIHADYFDITVMYNRSTQ